MLTYIILLIFFLQNPDASAEDVTGISAAGDNPNLLSINPGSGTPNQTPFNRRSLRSSRRRKRPSSCGPTNRRSLREKMHHSKGSSNSQPSSPTTLISPIITVDPPNQSLITRPDKLDVPDCYGSVTLQVPERTVSFSHMTDSTSYLDGQYSDSSNPGSAISYNTPNSNDTYSASTHGSSRPDWALDGAYETDSLEEHILPEIQVPHRRNVSRVSRQDTVEARIASADIKSIVRPKQLSAMQNQSRQSPTNHSLLPCQESMQNDKSSGMQLHSRQKTNDSLFLPVIDNVESISVKVEPRQAKNSCLLLPSSDNVDRVDLLSDDRENSNCSPNLNEDLSGDQLLDIATGGDSVELANTTMQFEGCSKNTVVYNTDSSPEQTEESADELENSIKNIDNSVKRIVLNNTNDANSEISDVSSVNSKCTPERNCDKNSTKQNSIRENCILTVKSQHEEICKPYIVDLGVPYSRNNSPKYIETNIDAPNDQIVYIPPSDSRKNSCNSLPPFVMPNTPTRQRFTSPIARIDSFHSEDFDTVAFDGDVRLKCQSNATTPSSSVNTPTFPCFAYKLQLHKKKNAKLKSSKQKEDCETFVKDEKIVTDKCSR